MTPPDADKRHPPPSRTARLADRTWTEVRDEADRVLLVPVGSCEQHGPHLPLDTDTRVALAVADAAARRRADLVIAPAVAYGASGEHAGFPGTLSVGTEALRALLVELGRSAFPPEGPRPWRALVLVDGHGGNREAVGGAVRQLRDEGRPVTSWSPRIEGGDAHAGRSETSLLLAIHPVGVRDERPVGQVAALAELLPALRAGGVASVSPDGVLGDASGASAEEGERVLASLVDDLLATVEQAAAPS
jgi:creatinine amidohydrolase